MIFSRLYSFVTGYSAALQTAMSEHAVDVPEPLYRFSEGWKVLGPFQIGTREAVWGADPLEHYGGFGSLEYDENATFASSLATNGSVGWRTISGSLTRPDNAHAGVDLLVDFEHVEWETLRDVYGWASYQWQAWLRGEILVGSGSVKTFTLHTPQILEFVLDDVHYFGGDFYSYERASPTVRLEPGPHRLDIRLVRDVRAMGGVDKPSMQISLTLAGSWPGLHPKLQPQTGVLLSDLLETAEVSRLASPLASLVLRNDDDEDLHVYAVEATHNACLAKLLSTTEIRLVPGQSRPVAFRLSCIRYDWQIRIDFKYRRGEREGMSLTVLAHVNRRSMQEPHKVTFLHPSGSLSYAILRPPSVAAIKSVQGNSPLPVGLGLHGAGAEAEWDLVRLALEPVPDLPAWVLFPTGGTPWSGDDWHAWGLSDVEAALEMIPEWIAHNEWQGPGVDNTRWLVAGHSNGGQGTWYTLLHRPDNVIAAAPLSGYSSIQTYVPFTFWQPADPGRTAVVQASLNSYRHELLLPNAKGIPVLQQHGSADDNVPPYHSRLMRQLIGDSGANSTYIEWPGKPHFWDGVFTTSPLAAFYQEQLNRDNTRKRSPRLDNFELALANPADTGAKEGVRVLQLHTPGQLGRINVTFDASTGKCSMRTTNIRTLQLAAHFGDCSTVALDGQDLTLPRLTNTETWTLSRHQRNWHIETGPNSGVAAVPPRLGRQLGQLDSILRTHGAFQIVEHSPLARHISLQISRNLCQYLAADTSITSDYDAALQAPGNIISVIIGHDVPKRHSQDFALQIQDSRILLRTSATSHEEYIDHAGAGLVAIFLRPLPSGRLELVIWGSDEASLAIAARLVPMMPGSGQPDFIVTNRRMLAKGLEGVLAMGFFDSEWEVSRNSFIS